MKIIRGIEQRSVEWFTLRAGKVTASGIKNLVTDKLVVRKWSSDMPQSYLHLKLAEKWRGCPQESFGGNRMTDQGVFGEPQAGSVYTALHDNAIEKITGIESDDGSCWCSPDGWLRLGVSQEAEGNAGLEIKCPLPATQIGYLLAGGLPEEYLLQVQFSLWLTGAQVWHFFSYCRDLPELFIPISRDDEALEAIEIAVNAFREEFDSTWSRLCDQNGGPPKRASAAAVPQEVAA